MCRVKLTPKTGPDMVIVSLMFKVLDYECFCNHENSGSNLVAISTENWLYLVSNWWNARQDALRSKKIQFLGPW